MRNKAIWLMLTGSMSLALLAVSCYSAPAASATPATPVTPPATQEPAPTRVDISGFVFSPATSTITVGTTVTWTNKDLAPHTVSSQDTLFNSLNLSRGATFSYTFNQKGTFDYRCKTHPSMNGKVVVE